MWFYFITDFEFSCLATLAKPYPLSDPTYMPHIPNLLASQTVDMKCLSLSIGQTDVSFHIKTICFVYKTLMLCI